MFRDSFWGSHGFEDLRKYVKQGNEFSKEVGFVMQERSDLEFSYAKSLTKMSNKLAKSATGCLGTLASAWSMAATELETEAELHRSLAQSLSDEIYKPMKHLAESQHKHRKPIENSVEKAVKALADRKSEETKYKRQSHSCYKDREKLCGQMQAARTGKRTMTEKDVVKLEKKIKQLEDEVRKVDESYSEAAMKAESARQDWESSVLKAADQLQTLEEERISHMHDFLGKYNSHVALVGPKLSMSCEKLGEAVISVDLTTDLRTVVDQKGTGPNQPEQILIESYAEDNSTMDTQRRRQSLQSFLMFVQRSLEREVRGKEGVEKLVEVYQNRPNFADAEAQDDARQRLAHVSATLNYLEACHHKFSMSLANIDGKPQPVSKYNQYIDKNRDKQGLTVSTLRLPSSMIHNRYGNESSTLYRSAGDGGAAEEQYDDDDDFDSYDDQLSPVVLGQCRAIYDYPASQYDELTIHKGDMIKIFDKQEDGWWQGELNGKVGIFPATYVEEIAAAM